MEQKELNNLSAEELDAMADALLAADEALYGGDSSDGAAGLLANAQRALTRVSAISAPAAIGQESFCAIRRASARSSSVST